MLYLLLPNLTLKWSDLPATSTIKVARENDVDLSQLPWEPSERPVTQTLLRWALRHGVVCAKGLILHAPNLSVIDTPNDIRESHEALKESLAKLASSEGARLIEQVMPGSAEQGRQLDAAVDASTETAIAKAEEELREALSAEPDEHVVTHWTSVGGPLPSPL